jgi:preprotein translocase subunit SecD
MERVPADQRAEAIPWTISVLEKRLSDCLGYASAVSVYKYSSDRILIRLAHVDAADLVRAKSLIVTPGRLEFRLVNDVPDARNEAEEGHPVPGCTPFVKRYPKGAVAVKTEGWYAPATFAELKSCGSDWLLVRNTAEITGQSLARAYATVDWNQSPAVGFEFNAEGRKKFALMTDRNIGRQLAIVLDDKLYSAPVIKSRISGGGIIEGSFTKTQVEDLVVALRSGALLAPLVLESERSFGPARAKESGADRK